MLFSINVFAATPQNTTISLDLHNVSLAETLHMIAKLKHENIIVNPTIHAEVTLHLHNVSAQKIFAMLLHTYDLVDVRLGDAGYITTRSEWTQHEQDQLKQQETSDALIPLETHIWQLHYANAQETLHLLQDSASSLISKRGHVRVDARTNILYVQDASKNIQQINTLLKRIDIPVQQVVIETHLASVDSDFERNLGVTFSASSDPQVGSLFSKTRYGLLVARLADGSMLDVQLSALENSGHGELISSPRLFTANQQTAAIESGEEIPYQSESPSGGTSTVFKKAVLSLKVTPQILPGNKVLLQLQINQDKPSKRVVQGVPAINTRQITTNVLLKDGQTVVLGGIYESDKEQARQSIPFLGKIPLLGLLFQQNDIIQNKRELLIFVTPRVIPFEEA